jgi:chemotaxis protein MotB
MKMRNYSLVIIGSATLLFSCVSNKKFQRSEARARDLQSDSLGTHRKLDECNNLVTSLKSERLGMQQDKSDLDKAMMELETSSSEQMASSKMTIADQAKRLKDLQSLIQGQKDILTKLRTSLANALVNFKPDELTVTEKNGKLYVSLQEKLLFKSGSAIVDPKGKEALKSLAAVLANTKDIGITIEGHTDNVPVTGKYEDNWSLSTARATAIVRVLTVENAMSPLNISAAGRAAFYPVADNNTVEGKSKNRRTEIILTPDLTDLFSLIGKLWLYFF